MRTLLFIGLTFSFSAMAACPNLAGTYVSCTPTSGAVNSSSDMVVTQKKINGVWVYSITQTDDESQERTTEKYIANGKAVRTTQSDGETGMTLNIDVTTSCESTGGLKMDTLVLLGTDQLFKMTTVMTKVGNQLKADLSGVGISGEAVTDRVICE